PRYPPRIRRRRRSAVAGPELARPGLQPATPDAAPVRRARTAAARDPRRNPPRPPARRRTRRLTGTAGVPPASQKLRPGRPRSCLPLQRLEARLGAALDAGGDQLLDLEPMADQFEHPQFLLARRAIG